MERTTKLQLEVGIRNQKSIITHQYFTSPLKLGTPRSLQDRLHIVFMMASAGILKGDQFSYEIKCDANTKTKITEQSYTKIFDTGDGSASRKQQITLENNASLYYRPSTVIPFQNSSFNAETDIHLEAHSELVWVDIMSAGRIAMNERFLLKHYRNRVRVFLDNRLIFMDHCLLEPSHLNLDGMLFFDHYTHQGTFYYYGTEKKQCTLLDWYKNYLNTENANQSISIGMTQCLSGICVRALAGTAQDLEELFDELAEILNL